MKYVIYRSNVKKPQSSTDPKIQLYNYFGEYEMDVPVRTGEYMLGKRIIRIDYRDTSVANVYTEGDLVE